MCSPRLTICGRGRLRSRGRRGLAKKEGTEVEAGDEVLAGRGLGEGGSVAGRAVGEALSAYICEAS